MEATKILFGAITVILVVSTFTPYVLGIKCYQCNSFEDKGCDVILPYNATDGPYLKECDNISYGQKPVFCRKIVQEITALEQIHTRIVRKCSYEKSEKDCYFFEDDDHSETVCQCFQDGCNGAERLAIPGSLWKTTLPVVVASVASSVLVWRL